VAAIVCLAKLISDGNSDRFRGSEHFERMANLGGNGRAALPTCWRLPVGSGAAAASPGYGAL